MVFDCYNLVGLGIGFYAALLAADRYLLLILPILDDNLTYNNYSEFIAFTL